MVDVRSFLTRHNLHTTMNEDTNPVPQTPSEPAVEPATTPVAEPAAEPAAAPAPETPAA